MEFYKYHDFDTMTDSATNGFYKMTTITTTTKSSSRNSKMSNSHTEYNTHTTHITSSSSSPSSSSVALMQRPSGGPIPDSVYVEKLQAILGPEFPAVPIPMEPTPLIGVIYMGTSANAENKKLLKSLGIRHLLNCAGTTITNFRRKSRKLTSSSTIKTYEEIYAEDMEYYEIRSHFDQAHRFLDKARNEGGKILIYCPSVNRSGAIAISYLMRLRMPLLQAAHLARTQRKAVLYNIGFVRQLVAFARDRLMLDTEIDMFDTDLLIDDFKFHSKPSYFPMLT